MGTKRLSQVEKNDIKDDVSLILSRFKFIAECPVASHAQFFELVETTRPDSLREAEKLVVNNGGAINRSYGHSIMVGPYRVSGSSPSLEYTYAAMPLPHDHPLYSPLVKFCEEQLKNEETYEKAWGFFTSVLSNCSTAGQLVRVLPFIKQFLGETAAMSLAGAERQSRWPNVPWSEWTIRPLVQQLHDALALTSLITTKRRMAGVYVYRKEE